MLPRGSIIGSSINMKSYSTCLPGKKGYIFKKGNYKNVMLSRLFIVSFLSLLIFFLQDKYKTKNNISSESQFKYNISRRLAEPKENMNDRNSNKTISFSEFLLLGEEDMNDRNSDETISRSELLSLWESSLAAEERNLAGTLEFLLRQLNKEAPAYNIDQHGKNKIWSSILKDVNKCSDALKHVLNTRLEDLVRSGSCTREESKKFLDSAAFLWNKLRYMTEKEFWNRFNRSRRSKFNLFS